MLIFDEFQYTFNLLDEDDWDEHELDHDYSSNYDIHSDMSAFTRRRTMYDEEYEGENTIEQFTNPNSNRDHASKCTNVLPVIFKQLCVHWNG